MRAVEKSVRLELRGATLQGDLALPESPRGLVLFAHGSGSGRHSPRNRSVAQGLRHGELGTLLIDLLTEEEERVDMLTRELRFDISLLAERLVGAIDWLTGREETAELDIGLFGASTGAGAALVAAKERKEEVGAVVSRGGRPDLAREALADLVAPTLLVVGGADEAVIELNRKAMAKIRAPVQLEIVPGAGHLFEEPGKLERVVELSRDWFLEHLDRA